MPSTLSQLGAYVLERELGRGGMGVVYLARDTRLGRAVAVKVLPESLADDAEHRARFEREAKLLASLNHPHIASIYGFEEHHAETGDIHFLVLEYVEGETLAERLISGPLPVEEALEIGNQIAEALEAAHEKGIIHRDLKPANVKITPAGEVKVLDFGLAKVFAGETQLSAGGTSLTGEDSPTMSLGHTRQGVILGTAAYMSPEQARGRPLDRRTDIWSFGCVLYEALTGQRAFSGATSTDTIAAIIEREANWWALPHRTPTRVRELLAKCLEKNPKARLRDIGDARIELERALAGREWSTTSLTLPGAAVRPIRWRTAVPWAVAASMTVLAVLALTVWRPPRLTRAPDSRSWAGFLVTPPAIPVLPEEGGASVLSISPDGRKIVYRAAGAKAPMLFLRTADQIEPRPIPGTEHAHDPFFSPDSQWLGFHDVDFRLMKVSLAGGAPATLLPESPSSPKGACWGPEGIIFSPAPNSGLYRVPVSGGAMEPLTTLDTAEGEVSHRWPDLLPGGKAVLYTVKTKGIASFDEALIAVRSLDGGPQKVLVRDGSFARYCPTGHIVYCRAGTIMAAPFDLERLALTGPSLPVLDGVRMELISGAAQFAFSADGVLAYVPGGPFEPQRELVWVSRDGTSERITGELRAYGTVACSPDGSRLALAIEGANDTAWVYDLTREMFTRVTFQGNAAFPIWTPDGKRVAYSSDRAGPSGLYWSSADGRGDEEALLAEAGGGARPLAFTPDGGTLLFQAESPDTGTDLWALPLDEERMPRPILRTPFYEGEAVLSPDGRWLAYQSDESGRFEVYLRALDGGAGRWQVSSAGGVNPLWGSGGTEIIYLGVSAGSPVLSAKILSDSPPALDKPSLLFEARTKMRSKSWDLSMDGSRLVIIRHRDENRAGTWQINVVLNWFDELEAKVAPAGSRR